MSDSVAIVGSGPNGLAAAVTMARAGLPVTVFESAATPGGGTRSLPLLRAGVLHDVCSAIHPMALESGFFKNFGLEEKIEFVVPEVSYANPLENGKAVLAYLDLELTARELGPDGASYERLYVPLLERLDGVLDFALGGAALRMPRDLRAVVSLALRTLEQGSAAWNLRFKNEEAPALITGVAAHSIGKMPNLATAAGGLVLGALGHARGWPVPVGGSRVITDALLHDLALHGAKVVTETRIKRLEELAGFKTIIFDTSTTEMLQIVGDKFNSRYRRALSRFRFGDAAAKVDFILDGPIPWQDERVAATPTVHLGGTRADVQRSEREVALGRHPAKPYVLLSQPTAFDRARNPEGLHTVWAYTHVPHGSKLDMTDSVTKQIERFAPGFRDRVIDSGSITADGFERYNSNYVGGDFSAGAITIKQLLARPLLRNDPWRTPVMGVYLASSATSPGPGVHGLNGWYAARSALKREYGIDISQPVHDVSPER